MATNVKKVQALEVELECKPGALNKLFGAFKEANVNVTMSWAFETNSGKALAYLCTTDPNKAKDVLTKFGKKPTALNACLSEGDDRVGCYAELLQKIEKAGVNLRATNAFGAGGKFAASFFVDEKNFTALCKALGC